MLLQVIAFERAVNASKITSAWDAGFEARGLIFGAPLALALGAAFVPLRKPGKLPGLHVKSRREYLYECR